MLPSRSQAASNLAPGANPSPALRASPTAYEKSSRRPPVPGVPSPRSAFSIPGPRRKEPSSFCHDARPDPPHPRHRDPAPPVPRGEEPTPPPQEVCSSLSTMLAPPPLCAEDVCTSDRTHVEFGRLTPRPRSASAFRLRLLALCCFFFPAHRSPWRTRGAPSRGRCSHRRPQRRGRNLRSSDSNTDRREACLP